MNLKMLFSFMVPKDRRFFPLFVKAADNLFDTSELLIKLIREPEIEKRNEYVEAIKILEHKGDDITKSLLEELNGTFITPFDREDIHELISNIDSVVDLIHTASKRIHLYKLPQFPPEFVKVADCIHSANKEIQLVLRDVKSASDFHKFQDSFTRIGQFENTADELYQQFISELFDKEENAILLIKKRDILMSLEKAIDKCEDVARIFTAIIVKLG
jgi:predicted phosphate transport protein (TIGR00153 family)